MCSHPRLGGVQARTEDNDRSNNVHLPYIVHLEFITYDGLGPTLRGNYSDTGIFKLYGSNASIIHYYVSHRNYDPGWNWLLLVLFRLHLHIYPVKPKNANRSFDIYLSLMIDKMIPAPRHLRHLAHSTYTFDFHLNPSLDTGTRRATMYVV